jgi:Uma2 family endonuclease
MTIAIPSGTAKPNDQPIQQKPLSNDYARKVEDYAALGIAEYWIADYAGLGGTRHIGKPKQPTLSICTLVNGEYEIQQLRGNQTIVSPTFPDLKLTAEQVLRAGR